MDTLRRIINRILREQSQIEEGLIKTYDTVKSSNKINGILRRTGLNINAHPSPDNPSGLIDIDVRNINRSNAELLKGIIDNMGYNVSFYELNDINNKTFSAETFYKQIDATSGSNHVTMRIQAKFGEESKIPNILYHLTTRGEKNNSYDKIMSGGLVPKSRKKIGEHVDAIYMVFTKEDAVAFFYDLVKRDLAKIEDIDDYVILEINTNRIRGLRLLFDPNSVDRRSVYTLNMIPKSAIVASYDVEFS